MVLKMLSCVGTLLVTGGGEDEFIVEDSTGCELLEESGDEELVE